jgi:hypothetical protein
MSALLLRPLGRAPHAPSPLLLALAAAGCLAAAAAGRGSLGVLVAVEFVVAYGTWLAFRFSLRAR